MSSPSFDSSDKLDGTDSSADISGTLTLTVRQARGLKSTQTHFHMSPYVTLSVPPYLSQSHTAVKGDVAPYWQSAHAFNIAHSADEFLVVSVVDDVTKQEIGRWECRLGQLVQPLYTETQWMPLHAPTDKNCSVGEIEMSVEWIGTEWREPIPIGKAHRFSVVSTAELSTASTDTSDHSSNDSVDTQSHTPPPIDTELNVIDRRSSSPSLPESPTYNITYSHPLPDDTYVTHNERHVSSALPALTNGFAAVHSSGPHGLLYDDTTYFDDRNFLQNAAPVSAICEVRVWSRDYIHGIQVVYAIDGAHKETPRYMGKVHTTMHTLRVDHSNGEFIIAVEGTYKEWLETLIITTNKRTKTFGGNVDHRAKRWQPSGNRPSPTSFRCEIPPGHRVVGFHGGYGVHIHNLGVSYQPINQNDKHRKGAHCIFKALRERFTRIKSG